DLDRGGIIATFLAILELIRQRRLDYDQVTPDAPLELFEAPLAAPAPAMYA
ncbi:MAG: segregation/condensation protein A, partial [Candidatus Eremiobacteraeota bacterium]|nr:segregation/condensation protein A [Candidatus Eremiobacteraeota bacterium]